MNKVKKFLALSLALVMMLSVASFGAVKEFTDQEDIPTANAEAVKLLSALNILSGYEDGSFRPAGTITRAEAAKMIYVLCNNGIDDGGEIYKGQNLFVDVEAGSWYEGYVNYCANVSIIAGRGNGVFDPQATVTGYELMKMLLVVAEYRPEIQGYTGGSWAANVLKDAASSGMTKDCSFAMNEAAPRHWAARLFYNTILNVDCALYLGDSLMTNPGILLNSQTVGNKRLGLEYEKAYVTGTKAVRLDKGADVYNYSEVDFIDLGYKKTLEIDFDVPNDYLGQEVRVVYKLNNANLDFNTRNTTVFGVYPTGTSAVYDTTIDAVTVKAVLDDSDLAVTEANLTGVSIKMDGYKATTYLKNSKNFNNLKNSVYDNEYTAIALGNDNVALSFYNAFNASTGNAVRFVDFDGDGILDYAFITETKYYKVNNLTATKASFTSAHGNINIDVEDINYVDEVVRNDIVAITENYGTGELVYDIRKVEPTSVTATKWTLSNTGAVTSVTLDGTAHVLALDAYANSLNKDHAVYFIDKGYVVASEQSADANTLPSNLAVITKIGDIIRTTDIYGDAVKYFYVDYLRADGTKVSARYDLTSAQKVTGAIVTADNGIDDEHELSGTITQLTTAFNTNDIVRFTKTDYGVYFAPYTAKIAGGEASYSDSNKVMNIGNGKFTVSDSAYFFAKYIGSSGTTYTVIKATDLKAFNARRSDNSVYAKASFYKNNSGNVETAYLQFDGALPTATTRNNYAIITGTTGYGVVSSTSVMFVSVVTTSGVTSLNVPLDDEDFFDAYGVDPSSTAELNAFIAACKYKAVKYVVDSKDLAALTPVDDLTGTLNESNRITDVYNDNFVLENGGLMTITENTQVFQISGTTVTTSNVQTTNAEGAYVVWNVETWANEADLVIINNDLDVKAYNKHVAIGAYGVANLAVVNKTDVSVDLSFADVGVGNSYKVEVNTADGWKEVSLEGYVVGAATSTSVTVSGLDPSTSYSFRIVVAAGSPRAGTSNSVTVTTDA